MADSFLSFSLPDDFIDTYTNRDVPWGFPIGAGNSLGELTFLTKYSRRKEDGSKETWVDTCKRVIEGMFSIQKDWCKENRLPWNENKAQATARDAFERLFIGKWTPPGRGLWMMGTEFVHANKNSAALQNCSFLSTEHISTRSVHDAIWPFVRLMEMSMLGVGVGFDTKGADKLAIHAPTEEVEVFTVEDSREGWCISVGKLLESYFFAGRPTYEFDYSSVRPSGEPINGFGGIAAGPGPLKELHRTLKEQFDNREGERLTSTDIVDIQNKIGKCITGDTWVLTVDGPRQVRDLVGVKTDLIVNGRTYKMISDGFWKTGEKEVFDLKTDRGYSLSLTAEHQVLTESGWKKAEDISIGEKIVLHNHENFSWSGTGTQEDGYLLGLLVGDGSIRKVNWGSGELALLFTWDQDKGSEFTKKAVESAMEGRKRRSDAIGWQKNGGEGRWMFQSSSITELARSYGIVRGNKTITPYVEEASSEFYVGFFRGLFDADASVNPETRTITLHQSDLELIQAAQRMLARLGIVSNINGPYRGKEYNLYIPAQHSDAFMERVGFANTRKSDTFYSKPRIYAAREKDFSAEVVEFTYFGTEEVFDVSVEEIHAFDANGVYVHNCVVAGNVRRSAEIALGEADDKDFLDLKNFEANPERMGPNGWGYTSNNSIIAEVGGNYDDLADRIAENGEPGLLYLDLCRKYGRLIDPPNNKDYRVAGTNPCAEQSLESGECCTLVETFPVKHDSLEDYKRTIKVAYLYAKSVTLLPTHWPETNSIMQRNRRIGCSISGVAQFAERYGWSELKTWLNKGYTEVQRYDVVYSDWLGVRESVKTTSVKPSGTVSLLFGVTPGVHWPTADVYIRRMRLASNDPLLVELEKAGYHTEPDVMDPTHSIVVELPTHGPQVRTEREVTMWEKAALAVLAQRYWADNQVSVTITFQPHEKDQIGALLRSVDGQLKSISMLPLLEVGGAYAQMPYERISEEDWQSATNKVKAIDWSRLYQGAALDAEGEKFCSNDVCEIPMG